MYKQLVKNTKKFYKKNTILTTVVMILLGLYIVNSFFGLVEGFGGGKSDENLYSGSDVTELTKSDFIEADSVSKFTVKGFEGKRGLVVFYAPWCGHCKNMVTDFKSIAGKANANKKYYAAVNCEQQKELAEKVGVKSFPTIKIVDEKGNMSDYNGGRSAEEMSKTLNA